MNTDIATACATRPADRARQVENQILNEFETTLLDLRKRYGPKPHDGLLRPKTLKQRHAIRATLMNKAIARVTTRLHGAEIW